MSQPDPYAAFHPPGVRQIDVEELKTELDGLSPRIFAAWNQLQEIVKRHEATIQNRWSRKSKSKRKALLLEVLPTIPKDHLPDVEAWKKKPKSIIVDTENADAYLMPYINLEDLSKTEPLLIMLNARARNGPDEFAHSDVAAYRTGLVTQSIDRPFLNLYVMMFRGRKTPETYGELYHFDDHEDASDWAFEARGLTPGDGLNCLKIQAKLYEFLQRFCLKLLHDITEGDLIGPGYPVTDEPPPVSANSAEAGITSLSITSLESAYRLPARIDLDRLEAVVIAQVAELEDELWALREDPEAFANTILETKEHRQEMLLDTNGKPHPIHEPSRIHVLWERVITSVIVDKTVSVGLWHIVLEKVHTLRRALDAHKNQIDPAEDLPEKLAMAFYKLFSILERMEAGPVSTLKISFPGSPPMRSLFQREPAPNAHTPMINTVSKPDAANKIEQEFIYIMGMMWDNQKRHMLTTKGLLDMLNSLLQKEPSANALLTPYIQEQLGHFALITECLHQLQLFQPWADTFEHKINESKDQINKDFAVKTQWMTAISQMSLGKTFVHLGVPTDGRFRYPAAKAKTKENVEAMRSAEASLDAFWSSFLQTYQHTLSPRIRDIFIHRERQRTKPWAEPIKSTPPAKGRDAQLAASVGGLHLKEQQVSPAPAKTKTKTRGASAPEKADAQPVAPAPRSDAAQKTIQVDKRALKVFNALFFSSDPNQQASETNWSDFLYAMTKTGFATEKIYGSVWQFTPTGLESKKPLQLHEPHPSSKIPFWLGRRIGRRLNRTYGWDRAMFSA
ncbi:hypothetical protein HYQ44_002821 [Verticillium longisporum]|nr:hypothetical protein HYQ44_002821 [Verticillium longisporum]